MNRETHIKAVLAHLDKLLADAEKRTQGRWVGKAQAINSISGVINYCITDTGGFADGVTVAKNCSTNNAAFIASCAGNAEAGWKSTKAALILCEHLLEYGNDQPWLMHDVERKLTSILESWPIETLQ